VTKGIRSFIIVGMGLGTLDRNTDTLCWSNALAQGEEGNR